MNFLKKVLPNPKSQVCRISKIRSFEDRKDKCKNSNYTSVLKFSWFQHKRIQFMLKHIIIIKFQMILIYSYHIIFVQEAKFLGNTGQIFMKQQRGNPGALYYHFYTLKEISTIKMAFRALFSLFLTASSFFLFGRWKVMYFYEFGEKMYQ